MAALNYIRWGNGPTALLMFHGYGQDQSIFNRYSGDRYTFYSVDLFFHGKSNWDNGDEPLEKTGWKNLIATLLSENNIDNFGVLGFSMGGKFALATLEAFPERVKEIILLAPDGVKTSFWYSLATYPLALRKVFRSMIGNHKRFLRIAALAKFIGLIDKGVLRFVETQMDSEEKRKRVYYSWVVFRHLKFDLDKIAELINKNNISFKLYVGRYDKIITAKNMSRFVSKIHHAKFEIVEAGHNNLIGKVAPLI